MGDPAASRDAALGRPVGRRWGAFAVVLVASFMSSLDVSVMAVAGPAVQRGLASSPAQVQWVITGYALTFGLGLIPFGQLGDAIGRRRVFLFALAGFVLSSAAAGASPTPVILIVARLVQGLSVGAMVPQCTALVMQLFPDADRGRAFGTMAAAGGVAMASGPVVGGAVLTVAGEPDGWRWTMLMNVPIGVAALIFGMWLIPASDRPRRHTFDLVGTALLGMSVLAVLLPLGESASGGLARLWWLLPIGVALGAVFVGWERRFVAAGREPVLDVGLLSGSPGFARAVGVASSYFAGFSGVWLSFALFFQDGLGHSPLQSALAVTPFAVGATVAASRSGRLQRRWGYRVLISGLSLSLVGLAVTTALLVVVPGGLVAGAVAAPLFLAGIGGGLVVAPNTTSAMRSVPASDAGVASGVLQTGQRIGAAIGTAVVAGVYFFVRAATGADAQAIAAAVAVAALGVAGALAIALRRRATFD
ncbi:MFS transporter [Pseudonocardia sp. TRM90224]|uniref:MFS transporter n=1 Tax=Pseudonocardia sp. TRM90224 TaxID=2812678 RepID=UPI001E41D3D3|nr:MFS transporter [Pseudonocardia sp. TRM90224]